MKSNVFLVNKDTAFSDGEFSHLADHTLKSENNEKNIRTMPVIQRQYSYQWQTYDNKSKNLWTMKPFFYLKKSNQYSKLYQIKLHSD